MVVHPLGWGEEGRFCGDRDDVPILERPHPLAP